MSCIFCKIIKKEIPADIIFEDEDVIAFKDVKPIAPVHVLVIPKKHIVSVADANDSDILLMGKLIMAAKKIAEDLKISNKGYKLLIRVGKGGGQEVDHIHLHLLGGARR
jgi:histidine triad (HIT) family protein